MSSEESIPLEVAPKRRVVKIKNKPIFERKQGVIGTSRWLAAMASRAHDTGQKEIMVSVLDLREITGLITALESIDLRDSAKTHVGWIRGDKVNEMKSGQIKDVKVIRRKTDPYDTEVFVVRLPKKVVLDEDQIPMDAELEVNA